MITKNEQDIIKPYTLDSANVQGEADILYIPENEEDVVNIMKYLSENNICITFAGAGTGLTGGKTPNGGAIISTERLDKIIDLSVRNKTITIQPGVIFSEMDKMLSENNLFYPPNPTEINSTLGGNVATNASGARTFKYGATREFVNRLKIILVNGDVIDLKRGEVYEDNGYINLQSLSRREYKLPVADINMPQIKHAAGYYLKNGMDAIDLFIGSEGTLGFISEIELKLLERPRNILGGIAFFDNKSKMLAFVNHIRDVSKINNVHNYQSLNSISARLIEFFDYNSLNVLRPQFPDIPENALSAIWFEQEYNVEYEDELLSQWYEVIGKYTDYVDVTWFATDEYMHEKLRDFRHQLPLNVYEKLTNNAYRKVGTDTAVPYIYFNDLYHLISEVLDRSGLRYVMFGHAGDSHLHANIFVDNREEFLNAIAIYEEIIDFSLSKGGTVSAEHGIGKIKKQYLLKMFGQEKINRMKDVKLVLDEQFLLNRGNVFD